ncbi:far1-related protein [Stylonychia lemnae]|uniref:Far1-related protein n=1 Tax=Stylonychia lemnae TaxID=5949 RepID=A0A078AZJ6_STYLE|nr:far1-related protein [Stylonychia lemnae]|eukprot:CDW86622.1 far1-related protein [Stylonychia lemnae]
MTSNRIRIHVYFGSLCKSEVIDQSVPFDISFSKILLNLGIPPENHNKYVMKLTNGGVVERSEVLYHDDRVIILIRDDIIPLQQPSSQQQTSSQNVKSEMMNPQNVDMTPEQAIKVKKELESNQALLDAINSIHLRDFNQIFRTYRLAHMEQNQKLKNEVNHEKSSKHHDKHKKSKHSALINNLESQDLKHERIQYKTLLKKRVRRDEENEEQIKIEENLDECNGGKLWSDCNVVRKIDYDNLEVLLYKNQINDYHQLIDLINIWAVSLGFLVKLKRSPKLNADGSQTLRLYCQSFKRSEPLDGVDRKTYNQNPSCHFALTFKQDEKSGCWLMYQEYLLEFMKHNHKLEKRRYDSIREYVKEYHDKVKSLSELKELIYDKFGMEYTLNQITYFKGKWTGEAVAIDKEHFENDSMNLLRLLKRGNDDFLEVEFDPNDKNNITYLFYSSGKMKEQYLKNSDVIFINKRFSQNRFKKPLVMIFTVSNTGKSVLLAIVLIEKEETSYFQRMAQCFLKHMNNSQPETCIIERQLKLYQALNNTMQKTKVLFCFHHIQKTFKAQYAFLERERPEDFMKIQELPIIENEQIFEQQIQEVNRFNFANEYYKLIIHKLSIEKKIWPKWVHLKHFTGGICATQRNDQIKLYLKPALKKKECAVQEALKRLLTIDQKEFKLSNEFQKVSPKHEQIFRVAHFLNSKVKEHYTLYAFQKIKWNIAKAFRFEIREETDDNFIVQLKPSNMPNKKPWQPTTFYIRKTTTPQNLKTGTCECHEFSHSGFPCAHLCLLNYKNKIEHMDIASRWLKTVNGRQQIRVQGEEKSHKRAVSGLEDIDCNPSITQSVMCETQNNQFIESQSVVNNNFPTTQDIRSQFIVSQQHQLLQKSAQKVRQFGEPASEDEGDDDEQSQATQEDNKNEKKASQSDNEDLDVTKFLRKPKDNYQNQIESDESSQDKIPLRTATSVRKDNQTQNSQQSQASQQLNQDQQENLKSHDKPSEENYSQEELDTDEGEQEEDDNDEISEVQNGGQNGNNEDQTQTIIKQFKALILNKSKRTLKSSRKFMKYMVRYQTVNQQ